MVEKIPPEVPPESTKPPLTPVRIFLRGLAVSLPAILTIVIVIWIVQFINEKLIEPATWTVKSLVAAIVDESLPTGSTNLIHIDAAPPLVHCGSGYLVTQGLKDDYFRYIKELTAVRRGEGDNASNAPPDWNPQQQVRAEWMQQRANGSPFQVYVPLGPRAVPYPVYAEVARGLPPGQMPSSSSAIYREYVADRKLWSVVPLSVMTILAVVCLLYFIGRFVSIRIGRWIVIKFEEQVLGRLPVVRNVYGSVKQVTDFVFTENQPVEYRRVIACEYPRQGIWSIGFVTGESMLDIAMAEGEPCVAVLIPTSPMPMTGFTVSVPRSQLVDLNITVEQAMQFCISCGVLTPPHQRLTRETLLKLRPRETRPKHSGLSLAATPGATAEPLDGGDAE